jgi:demethylmenaquinone methyltransferase / 2-methoxy-6-polyprenyl-1,4-benzoquinol methylase
MTLGYDRFMSTPTNNGPEAGGTASFGFRSVPEGERQGLVNQVFSNVASKYDLMNDLMSGGLHRLWKDEFVGMIPAPKGDAPFRLLDVAGGTGDIAIRYARKYGPGTTAVLADISPEMLAEGKRKVEAAGLSARITLVEGNAEALPFPDKSFDTYTIAFGIRNVTHIDRALAEAFRVLKIGGRLLCLEFSRCASSSRDARCRCSIGFTTSIPSKSFPASAPSPRARPSPTAIWSKASVAFRISRRSPA